MNPLSPKLSVLVTAYNIAPYLGQCLDSILAQKVDFTYQILVAEDCSTDDTPIIAENYRKKYPDIIKVFCNKKNLGYSANICNLIQLVQTEYMTQVDGDDYLIDNLKLQLQVDALDANPAYAICIHNYTVVDSMGNNAKPNVYSFTGNQVLPEDYLRQHILGPGNLVMIRRKTLPEKLPDWLPKCGNDVDYAIHCMASTEGKIFYIDKIMSAYRRHAGSITLVTQKKRRLEIRIFIVKNLSCFYKAKGLDEAAKFFRGVLPKRYMTLAYFYLGQGNILNFLKYFFTGFLREPEFSLREHIDMMYGGSPELVQKIKTWSLLKRVSKNQGTGS